MIIIHGIAIIFGLACCQGCSLAAQLDQNNNNARQKTPHVLLPFNVSALFQAVYVNGRSTYSFVMQCMYAFMSRMRECALMLKYPCQVYACSSNITLRILKVCPPPVQHSIWYPPNVHDNAYCRTLILIPWWHCQIQQAARVCATIKNCASGRTRHYIVFGIYACSTCNNIVTWKRKTMSSNILIVSPW